MDLIDLINLIIFVDRFGSYCQNINIMEIAERVSNFVPYVRIFSKTIGHQKLAHKNTHIRLVFVCYGNDQGKLGPF